MLFKWNIYINLNSKQKDVVDNLEKRYKLVQLICPFRSVILPPLKTWTSVAVAVTDVFSKNGHSIPNKFDKILKIFDRLDNVKSRGGIFYT